MALSGLSPISPAYPTPPPLNKPMPQATATTNAGQPNQGVNPSDKLETVGEAIRDAAKYMYENSIP